MFLPLQLNILGLKLRTDHHYYRALISSYQQPKHPFSSLKWSFHQKSEEFSIRRRERKSRVSCIQFNFTFPIPIWFSFEMWKLSSQINPSRIRDCSFLIFPSTPCTLTSLAPRNSPSLPWPQVWAHTRSLTFCLPIMMPPWIKSVLCFPFCRRNQRSPMRDPVCTVMLPPPVTPGKACLWTTVLP